MSSQNNESLKWFQEYKAFISQCVRTKFNRAIAYFEEDDVIQEVWLKFQKMKPGYLAEMDEDERRKVIRTTVTNVIIDMQRKESALTRSQQKNRQEYIDGEIAFMKKYGKVQTDPEMADFLGWTLEQTVEARQSLRWEADCGGTFDGLTKAYLSDGDFDSFLERVGAVAGMLSAREELIFLRTEVAQESNKEVAEDLGVSASRVSQVRQRALSKFIRLFEAH